MRIMVCDRCKKEIDTYHPIFIDRNNEYYSITRTHVDRNGMDTETTVDLCEECNKELIKWFENME